MAPWCLPALGARTVRNAAPRTNRLQPSKQTWALRPQAPSAATKKARNEFLAFPDLRLVAFG